MSDLKFEPGADSHSSAFTVNVLMKDLGEAKHRNSPTTASSESVAMTKDELVLAGFGKKQQLKVRGTAVSTLPDSATNSKTRLPYHAIFVTVVVELILGLVSIGSSTAFDAFYSVVTSAYYSTFLVAASVMLYKRLTTPSSQISWGPFQLGRWGVPITSVALAYTFVTFVFSFFPPELPVTASNMNYSVLIYGAGALMMLGILGHPWAQGVWGSSLGV